jgi:preprotein translocase subunit SecG
MSLFISVFTFILAVISFLLVCLVLMQRAKSDGGVGAAMAGSATESAFGAETNNVLSGLTIKGAIAFFVLSFVLYVANIYQAKHHEADDAKLPTVSAPAQSLPAAQPATPPPVETKK